MARESAPGQSQMHSWYIYRIQGTRTDYLGTVEARTAEEAVKRAITEFKITDPLAQLRLIAQQRT